MVPRTSPTRFLIAMGSAALVAFVGGVCMGILADATGVRLGAIALEALGAAVLFPIVVSVVYDSLRERWLGDEVWRIFGELADAGISRVYRDREATPNPDNAQARLAEEFSDLSSGEVRMMGVSLRVFFNPLGPFYSDIADMLRNGRDGISLNVLISSPRSAEAQERANIEEPGKASDAKPQIQRDIESSVATVRSMVQTMEADITLRQFTPAPYCTAVLFPHIAYYSPNLLAPDAPVRLPMILFRPGSHGYQMLSASFDYLGAHPETQAVALDVALGEGAA
jgi:hypothetical protein